MNTSMETSTVLLQLQVHRSPEEGKPDHEGEAAMGMYVAAGFEPVRAAFEQGVSDLGDGGGAFCAYVDGVPVADLWGGTARPGEPWAYDTRAVLLSLTKGLTALCVQLLVDRGQVDVDAPVSAYWPEFAAGGKQGVLVRHVLTHTAGVLSFPGAQELLGLDGTGWDDYEAIAKGLAVATPSWEPGTRFGYHALTFGRSEEHTSELQSPVQLVCRLLLEKKK